MLLVLPYCAGDAALASTLLDYLPFLGPYDGHQALLLHTDEGRQALPGLQEKAARCFSTVHALEVSAPHGWPAGPNAMFSAAALHIAASSALGPWYFFEPDCTPTRRGWLDQIEAAYIEARSPFMGAVTPTRLMRNGIEIEDGTHMVGTGIYPKETASHLVLMSTLRHTAFPWDVYLKWEILPHCHPTSLIQHCWSTCQAHLEGTGIALNPSSEIARSARVRLDAAVVHGVKDGSLINLFRKEQELQEAA